MGLWSVEKCNSTIRVVNGQELHLFPEGVGIFVGSPLGSVIAKLYIKRLEFEIILKGNEFISHIRCYFVHTCIRTGSSTVLR